MKQEPVYIEIDEYGDKYYCSDREMKVLHRADGPAVECGNGTKEWWQSGQRHRLDGPAIELASGHKEWLQRGLLHRTDGPAVEFVSGAKIWYANGRRHRTDGPAVEHAGGSKVWYIDGVRMTESEFRAATTVHELTLDDIADRLGIPVENLKIVKEH